MIRPALLLVDLSYQSYRAAASHANLTAADGTFTGGVYGFMMSVCKIIIDNRVDKVVVCEDVKPYVRSLEYPEYKNVRRKQMDVKAEEIRDKHIASLPLIKEMLDIAGIPVMGVKGYESDDCIGYVVRQHRGRYRRIIAASNDSDLFPMLKFPNFAICKKSDASDLYTLDSLREEFPGLEPDDLSMVSALMGTHNDIEGIKGVGPKTATKAVQTPGLLRQYREQWSDLIDRNLRLIRLPHPTFPRMAIPGRTRTYKSRDLVKWCSMFDITTTRHMDEAFEQVSGQ